jgi:beta-glucosidase
VPCGFGIVILDWILMVLAVRGGLMDVDDILSKMTLEEKASIVVGGSYWATVRNERLGLEPLYLNDGSHGLRKQVKVADNLGLNESLPATCFPTASAVACSFDVDLARQIGAAIAEECRKENTAVILGPGANIKRSPLCGRNFEYYSEDPLLSGEMAAGMIDGIQSVGVGASLKHFAANNQEKARMTSDSVVDERTLNEMYLRPFEIAVRRSNPWCVMGAYNKLNGTHCTENRKLIKEKLEGEWGYIGAFIADWGALNDYEDSIRAGLDLSMPGPLDAYSRAIVRGVHLGRIPKSDLDRAARNVLGLYAKHERACKEIPYSCDMGEHAKISAKAARESAVLLKNDGTLPISPNSKIAVIGSFAKHPRFQGAGSSRINPYVLDCAWDAFSASGLDVSYADGYDCKTGEADEAMLSEAVELARSSDVAVIFAGLPDRLESEGYDRRDMKLPKGNDELISRVCEANPHTVVVLSGGAPMELPWRNDVAAILLIYLAGCQGGSATVDLLLGRANPCGKLAETWPEKLDDTALADSFPDLDKEILYKESIFVGYRYFDSAGVEPAYEFGHGMSYSKFEYANLKVEPSQGCYRLSFEISNLGPMDGKEVWQVYVRSLDSKVFMPFQQLAAFSKCQVPVGQKEEVDFELGPEAFSYWDTRDHAWRVDSGRYEIRVGTSSRDIRLSTVIELSPGGSPFEVRDALDIDILTKHALYPYYDVRPHRFPEESFKVLYGGPFPKRQSPKPIRFDSPVGDLKHTFVGRLVLDEFYRQTSLDGEVDDVTKSDNAAEVMVNSVLFDSPLRVMTLGGITHGMISGAVDFLNWRFLRGLLKIVVGYNTSPTAKATIAKFRGKDQSSG